MARAHIIREARSGDNKDYQLCFQWCRYVFDDASVEYGYRFVWRRDDGSLQAARGQARIPSLEQARALMNEADSQGWGDRDGDKMEKAAERLRAAGCVVDFASGYVGWPNRDAALKGHLTTQIIDDERIIRDWS